MESVPVVLAASTHPVERGLVSSLGRPGGNITGIATFTGEMFAKRVQLPCTTQRYRHYAGDGSERGLD
jgi:hypothetical protein